MVISSILKYLRLHSLEEVNSDPDKNLSILDHGTQICNFQLIVFWQSIDLDWNNASLYTI